MGSLTYSLDAYGTNGEKKATQVAEEEWHTGEKMGRDTVSVFYSLTQTMQARNDDDKAAVRRRLIFDRHV